jgi:hypothetical protein
MTKKTNKPQAAWKRMVALAGALFLTGAAQASPTVVNGAFSDDFTSYTQTSCLSASTFGVWNVLFTGYGCVTLGAGYAQLSPQAGNSHATLVVGPSFTAPMSYSVDVKTIAQLDPAAAPWEVGWVLWDVSDNTHFYSFTLQSNGWELAKEDPAYPGAQRFLATGSSPSTALGVKNTIKVMQTSNTMSVYVNGQLVTTFTDNERPYTSGQIALYAEESTAQYSNVVASAGSSSSGGGVATVSSLAPATVTAGAAAFNLAVTGTGFQSGSVVYWNGVACTSSYQSATLMLGYIPAADIAAAGTTNVTVATPGASASNALAFTVASAVASTPAPTVSSLAPATVTAGAAAFNLTVTGTGFQTGSVVHWNGVACTSSYQSATLMLGYISAADIAAAGTGSVTVTTPGAAVSNAAAFTVTSAVVSNPAPAVSALSPSSLTAGSAAINLKVNGTGFKSGAVVYWNGAPVNTVYQSSTLILAYVSQTALKSKGTATVTVMDPGTSASNPVTFTVM